MSHDTEYAHDKIADFVQKWQASHDMAQTRLHQCHTRKRHWLKQKQHIVSCVQTYKNKLQACQNQSDRKALLDIITQYKQQYAHCQNTIQQLKDCIQLLESQVKTLQCEIKSLKHENQALQVELWLEKANSQRLMHENDLLKCKLDHVLQQCDEAHQDYDVICKLHHSRQLYDALI